MVEGGKIDHACHANAPATMAHETLAFDRAVKAGLDFLNSQPDTLILVGGDHETGGASMGMGGFKGDKYAGYFMSPDQLLNVKQSHDWVAVESYRMARKDPAGAVELIKETSGISDFTEEELQKLLEAAELTRKEGQRANKTPNPTYMPYLLGFTYVKILSDRARVGWTSYSHTGHPVLMTAAGPGSEKFSGYYHITEIAHKMAALWDITLGSKPMVKKPSSK
jgi:alkaline phosphatase